MKGTNDLVGIFSLEGVEEDKLQVKSRRLRNLKKVLLTHLNIKTHSANYIENSKNQEVIQSKARRNKEIGLKLGSSAYF